LLMSGSLQQNVIDATINMEKDWKHVSQMENILTLIVSFLSCWKSYGQMKC